MRILTNDEIGQISHAANRELQLILNNPNNPVAPPWVECSEETRQSVVAGVKAALSGMGPEELHDLWCKTRYDQGWRYGPVKDESLKTHPCLISYGDLPAEEKLKDSLFYYIVGALY